MTEQFQTSFQKQVARAVKALLPLAILAGTSSSMIAMTQASTSSSKSFSPAQGSVYLNFAGHCPDVGVQANPTISSSAHEPAGFESHANLQCQQHNW